MPANPKAWGCVQPNALKMITPLTANMADHSARTLSTSSLRGWGQIFTFCCCRQRKRHIRPDNTLLTVSGVIVLVYGARRSMDPWVPSDNGLCYMMLTLEEALVDTISLLCGLRGVCLLWIPGVAYFTHGMSEMEISPGAPRHTSSHREQAAGGRGHTGRETRSTGCVVQTRRCEVVCADGAVFVSFG